MKFKELFDYLTEHYGEEVAQSARRQVELDGRMGEIEDLENIFK